MRNNKTLMDDLIALSGNVLGNVLGARHEMKVQAKQRIDSLAQQLNLVGRREFDAAFAMLSKAREMQEELNERLSVIEQQLNKSRGSVIKSRSKRRLPSLKKSNQRRKHSNRG